MGQKADTYGLRAAGAQVGTSRKLEALTPGISWFPQNGMFRTTINPEEATWLQALLKEDYGIESTLAPRHLNVNIKEEQKIKKQTPKYTSREDLMAAAKVFYELENETTTTPAAPKEAPAKEEKPGAELDNDAVLKQLRTATGFGWRFVEDGSSALNGKFSTVGGVKNQLAEQQSRKCKHIKLDATIEQVHSHSHLVVEPDVARAFAHKRLSRGSQSSVERAAASKGDFGVTA